jgi:hypothetical protein
MTQAEASELRSRLDGMIAEAAKIPPARALYLPVVLRDAATPSTELTRPRALALLGALGANLSYLRRHPIPAERVDTHDADGITYRFFPDHGFQFHPLAAFARLNVLITKGRRAEVERLAAALVDRGVPVGNALTWEYYFPVNGGPARWTSALAQAAAADALARAGQLLDDRSLTQSAQAAYAPFPLGSRDRSAAESGSASTDSATSRSSTPSCRRSSRSAAMRTSPTIGPPMTSSGDFRPPPSPCSRSSTRAAGRGIRSTDRRPPSTITAITSTYSASSRCPPARRSGPPRRAAGADISRARGARPSPRRRLGYPVSAPPT